MTKHDLSLKQARRIALTAQGFAESRRHAAPGRGHFGKVAGRLGVIQMDSVNVLTRTHYLPAFSRLGDYSQGVLEAEAWGRKRTLFEYWGHEASLMPLEMQPLFRWRMARALDGETWTGLARFAREKRDYIDNVLTEIEKRRGVTGGDFAPSHEFPGRRGQAGWWTWSDGKRALEWLFWTGQITTLTRRGFERVYDITERALPAAITGLPTPSEEDAQRELVRRSAKAMGVATEADLRDYYRLPLEGARRAVRELVEAGELTPVKVQGWDKPGYLHPDAKPRRITAHALLSPFDNLIWFRDRAERLFGIQIRLEIYTPAEKRVHGYYVLPFLEGEAITARVDLKADRQGRALRVQASHTEPEATGETPAAVAAELTRMAGWLGLDRVEVVRKGDLAPALAAALGKP
jgi:uncharacterized protein YcaQ